MERKRSYIIIWIIAFLVSIVAVSISYAALNTTLKIDGDAKALASNWKIKYANLSNVETTGKAEEITAPTINTNDTTVGDYSVTLTAPGDSITYKFDVVNEGTFDAEITSFTLPTPTCKGSGTNADIDADNVCKNLEYTLKYDNGTSVAQGDELKNKNDTSGAHTKHLVLKLTYKSEVSAEELPKEDVTINNLGITTIYSQK